MMSIDAVIITTRCMSPCFVHSVPFHEDIYSVAILHSVESEGEE